MGICHSKVYPEHDICHQCKCKIITMNNTIVCSYCNIKLHHSCYTRYVQCGSIPITSCTNCFALGSLNCISSEINPEYVLLQ